MLASRFTAALLVTLVLTAASPLLACQLDAFAVIPPRPTSNDPITLSLAGSCPDACTPSGEQIRVEGKTIRIDYPTNVGCVLVPATWKRRVDLGRVAPGTYEVILGYRDRVMSRQSLTVRDASAEPFQVLPSFGKQGTEVWLRGVPDCPGTRCLTKGVRFNGVDGVVRSTAEGLFARVPSLTEGVYDVSVVSPDGSLLTSKGSFTYVTRFDSANYARVLFPLVYAGPGAGGSMWTSQNVITNRLPVSLETIPAIWLPEGIGSSPPQAIPPHTTTVLPTQSREGGALLLLPRGLESFAAFSSHVRDTSRAGENNGTEIRVVTEGDTSHEVFITGIPGDPRYRPRLRIYDIDGDERPLSVEVISSTGFRAIFDFVTPRRSFVCVTTPCEDAAFAVLDVLGNLPTIPPLGSFQVRVSGGEDRRLWAFVTLTNNETQQVTTYSPNR